MRSIGSRRELDSSMSSDTAPRGSYQRKRSDCPGGVSSENHPIEYGTRRVGGSTSHSPDGWSDLIADHVPVDPQELANVDAESLLPSLRSSDRHHHRAGQADPSRLDAAARQRGRSGRPDAGLGDHPRRPHPHAVLLRLPARVGRDRHQKRVRRVRHQRTRGRHHVRAPDRGGPDVDGFVAEFSAQGSSGTVTIKALIASIAAAVPDDLEIELAEDGEYMQNQVTATEVRGRPRFSACRYLPGQFGHTTCGTQVEHPCPADRLELKPEQSSKREHDRRGGTHRRPAEALSGSPRF